MSRHKCTCGGSQENRCNKCSRGPRGPRGLTGPAGPPGPAGPKGETGSRGPRGLTGLQGPPGIDGLTGVEGPAGPEGPMGPEGPAGPRGEAGPQGPKGDSGSRGETGQRGERGEQGPKGERGEQGPIGPKGEKGIKGDNGDMGPPGPRGEKGEQGARGETGPPGGIAEFAYIYHIGEQRIPRGGTLVFNDHGLMTTGISHGAENGEITVHRSGIYEIQYTVSARNVSQWALFVNDAEVPASRYGIQSGNSKPVGILIMALQENDVLTLRNNTSEPNQVNLSPEAGGSMPVVTASIILKRLAQLPDE